ncbi:MAG: M23 family metallopeptidase [Pyrinomonadaceae bacterium]
MHQSLILFLLVLLIALFIGCEKRPSGSTTPSTPWKPAAVEQNARPTPAAASSPTPQTSLIVVAPRLIIPVANIRAEDLQDTFSDARSEDRVHNAIDIMAPQGTPVLAAADGRIIKLMQSERGGITIYQMGSDERTVYYYTHLDRYEANLAEGQVAQQGSVIGYVGDSGNAGPGNYHLHFSIWTVSDPKRYWEGENINPYILLKQ